MRQKLDFELATDKRRTKIGQIMNKKRPMAHGPLEDQFDKDKIWTNVSMQWTNIGHKLDISWPKNGQKKDKNWTNNGQK